MDSTFRANGIITLTTDFGHRGPFVGTMKGVIFSRFAEARIVDLTNEAHVHWPAEAGFWIARCYHYFPPGTVHLGIVDPGVGTDRSLIVAFGDGHIFLGPDNGLLAEVVEKTKANVHLMTKDLLKLYQLPNVSDTFHGRDIFAPVAAALASGTLTEANSGPLIDDIVPSLLEHPEIRGGILSGVVVTTDHFGNLITNIEKDKIQVFSDPIVSVGGHEIDFQKTYGNVTPGTFLALFNSSNVLEVACAEQNASQLLSMQQGAPVQVYERQF
jgi:S-adenosylmethionine hydrolase